MGRRAKGRDRARLYRRCGATGEIDGTDARPASQLAMTTRPASTSPLQRAIAPLLEALVGPGESVLALNTRLAELLRSGATDPDFERRAQAALSEISRDKLAIARPGYERYDATVDA